jgi:hypothetical protein
MADRTRSSRYLFSKLPVRQARSLCTNADVILEELAQQRSLFPRSIATGARECAPDDKLRDASRGMDATHRLAAILRYALLSMNTLFMVRVQRQFWRWGLRMRSARRGPRSGETNAALILEEFAQQRSLILRNIAKRCVSKDGCKALTRGHPSRRHAKGAAPQDEAS